MLPTRDCGALVRRRAEPHSLSRRVWEYAAESTWKHLAIKAVVLAGVEITDVHRPQSVRRQRFKGAPMAGQAWDRWHRWRMLAQDTLYGNGGDGNALVVEDVGQSLFAKAWGVCLGLQHGIYETLRFGGAVDTGRTIT